MSLNTLEQATISTLQLHNAALILLLGKEKFDKADLASDLVAQGEMLAAIEDGSADLAAALRGDAG